MGDKYDISKTFKFSKAQLDKIEEIADKKNFDSDSSVMRYAINLLYALYKKDLLIETTSKIMEKETV